MTSTTFFIIFIPILAILLLAINLLLAPHNPYQEKDSAFECGFHSFLGQNRTQFNISFFIFGLLFLLFDLEILLVYPYSVSSYTNDIYGLVIMMVFFVLLTLGFIFELGKNALTIDSRQTIYEQEDISTQHAYLNSSNKLQDMLTDLNKTSDKIEGGPKLREDLGKDGENLDKIKEHGAKLEEELKNKFDKFQEQANKELNDPSVSKQTTDEINALQGQAQDSVTDGTDKILEAVQSCIDWLS